MMHTSGGLFGERDIVAVVPVGNPRENLVFVWYNNGAIHALSAHENATIAITADRIYSLQHLATSALRSRSQSLSVVWDTRGINLHKSTLMTEQYALQLFSSHNKKTNQNGYTNPIFEI